MAIIGDAGLWADTFPQGFIPEIISLIVETWSSFDKPGQSDLEVPITRRFRVALIKAKNLKGLPLRIEREMTEDDLHSGFEKGRIDLHFTAAGSANENSYFAIECKRLHAGAGNDAAPLVGRYVKKGMMRFVQSQYGSLQSHGGMIGYILDGDTDLAISRIDRFIRRNRGSLALGTVCGLELSTLLPNLANVRETRHQLERGLFKIHHILLPC